MPAPARRLELGQELTWQQGDDHLDYIDMPAPRVVTIVGGIIEITGPAVYLLEPESGLTDELIGITGGQGRQWPVILTLNTPGRTITVMQTLPNFLLMSGASTFLLNSLDDSIEFRDRTATIWREMRRCSVG